ncbi:MAG: glycine cleavage system protein GcvH [Acidimicrobiia bacterium]|nr:glycine cleavage system protein GcvH [Acidimicrobiia bacterium]
MNFPDDLRYAANHEWVRRDGETVRMGISDFAQDALGDVVFVELPDLGLTLSAGEAFAEVESTKSVSDIYAPVSGTVTAVNDALNDTPELINSDPYGEGWICEIEMTDDTDLDRLKDAQTYAASVQ